MFAASVRSHDKKKKRERKKKRQSLSLSLSNWNLIAAVIKLKPRHSGRGENY